jgi:acyl carrier protein
MRMMLALEDEFGIDLDETQIMEITSYAKIRALVGDFRAATS